MEFTILTCWSCDRQFYTASERSSHHLEAHERLARRDGTPLIVTPLAPQVGSRNGVGSKPEYAPASEGGA